MRIRHYIILPFIALMLIFGLASFSKGHLDNISIVTCIEVMEDEEGIYHLRAELADTKGSSQGQPQDTRTKLISADGTSLQNVWDNLIMIDSSIYTGHVRLILMDLETAERSGFEELSEFILDSGDIRFNTQIALYDAKSGDVLESETFVSGNKGLDISRSIRNAAAEEKNVNTEAFRVINSIGEDNRFLFFPVIDTMKTGEKMSAYVNDTAVFCGGKLIKRGRITGDTDTGFHFFKEKNPEDLIIQSGETEDREEEPAI